ncbi:hypothetical protein EB835_06475 [Brevibacterium sp. S22]|nr:hypothetical protein EB835_06475 [Brevibacterium sp. S22]
MFARSFVTREQVTGEFTFSSASELPEKMLSVQHQPGSLACLAQNICLLGVDRAFRTEKPQESQQRVLMPNGYADPGNIQAEVRPCRKVEKVGDRVGAAFVCVVAQRAWRTSLHN